MSVDAIVSRVMEGSPVGVVITGYRTGRSASASVSAHAYYAVRRTLMRSMVNRSIGCVIYLGTVADGYFGMT